jgi:hypothetical protein
MGEVKLTDQTRISRDADILAHAIDDETVMMSLERDNYYGLDATGSRIWALLENPHTIQELCEALMQEYEVDASTCRRDVEAFLQKLAEQRLVKIE